jgi:hypothetical protein
MEIYDMEIDLINKFDNFSNADALSMEIEKSIKLKKILTHTYIDGTVQEGKYINDEGKIAVGYEKVPDKEGAMRIIYDFYPKDKGFVEKDDKGRYFYFEPLPDFKMNEIKRLEKLRDDAIKADNEQKRLQALQNEKLNEQRKIQEEAKKRLEKEEAQKKHDEDNKIALRKAEIDNEAKLKLAKIENDAKKKKIAIISISSLAALFIGLKLFKKI